MAPMRVILVKMLPISVGLTLALTSGCASGRQADPEKTERYIIGHAELRLPEAIVYKFSPDFELSIYPGQSLHKICVKRKNRTVCRQASLSSDLMLAPEIQLEKGGRDATFWFNRSNTEGFPIAYLNGQIAVGDQENLCLIAGRPITCTDNFGAQ